MARRSHSERKDDGSMTTSQAGRKGGERVRELIEEGKELEEREGFHERLDDDRTHRSRDRGYDRDYGRSRDYDED